MIRTTSGVTLVYGLLVAILGYTGYTQSGSVISIVVGGSLGVLVAICAIAMAWYKTLSTSVAAAAVSVLLIAFGMRFSQTTAFMPAVMAGISAFVLFLLIRQLFVRRPDRHI